MRKQGTKEVPLFEEKTVELATTNDIILERQRLFGSISE